jgi:small GTP-binding protein
MSNSLEAKIVVLGSQGVGKTSLVHRYVRNAFTPPTTQSTIGASFLTKRVVDIDTSTVVRLQIWDTAGQERFRSISKLYYRGTLRIDTVMIVDMPHLALKLCNPSDCRFHHLWHALHVCLATLNIELA